MNMFMDTAHIGGSAECGQKSPTRRKIWEIDQAFRCPVVGMCLSINEQRQLCRKVGAAEHSKTDFAVHEMLVATMNAENPLSRKLEALLARKYEKKYDAYLDMAEPEFLQAWNTGIQEADYAGLLWAAAVRSLSYSAMCEIFGTLHMAMHEHAKAYAAARKDQRALRARNVQLGDTVRDLETANKKLRAENEKLSRSLAADKNHAHPGQQLRLVVNTGQTSLENPQNPERSESELYAQLRARDQEIAALNQALKEAHKKLAQVEEDFAAHLALDATMRKAYAGDSCKGSECGPQCPSYDLCEKRVLIVGGIERMEKAYRNLVEKRGGILEYHSGNMKSGRKALENSVQRADVVLCPVNCNSHGACLMVKNLGKKHKKPVHMLCNFSLSSLARTMDDIRVLSDSSPAVPVAPAALRQHSRKQAAS